MSELNKQILEKLFPGEPPLYDDYTTSMDAAFYVLQKLHSQGWFWRLDSVHDGVICTVQNLKRKTYSIGAKTAPLAICECAVKTLEEPA